MRVLCGHLKGRNFYMPKTVRPTPNIVRKAVFDIVGHDLSDFAFIDLFAGSGAVGLEALSCGARRVVFVENDSRVAEILSENMDILGMYAMLRDGTAALLNTDAFAGIKQLHSTGEKFDVAFIDPPYYRGLAKKALKTLSAYDIVQPSCLVILQHDKREALPEKEGRFSLVKQRKYGASFLTIYQGQDT